ncbi:MAG TPA: hypothetical protein VJ828_03015, partial [Lacipirellulaceae bacterium]|nr:hypothetical protein [Lacipirellulaceae bacterium]
GQVILQFDKTGSGNVVTTELSHRYLWGPAVDQLLADEVVKSLTDASQNERLWALADHLGSVRDVIDDDGTVRKHSIYDSYGRITGETFRDIDGDVVGETYAEAIDQLFAYTGHARDKFTNLIQARRRWFDADNVGNTPTSYVDDDGLQRKIRPGALRERNRQLAELSRADGRYWADEGYQRQEAAAANLRGGIAVARAFGAGLQTGAKAFGNAGVDTGVCFVTLGFVPEVGLIPITQADLDAGYAIGYGGQRVGIEFLVGVATAGASQAGKVGQAVSLMDVGGNMSSVGQGTYGLIEDGSIDAEDLLQIGGGAAGIGGNKLGLGAKPSGGANTPGTTLVPVGATPLGRWGESRLAQFLGNQGAKPTCPFDTSRGKRDIDRLLNGIATNRKQAGMFV